MSVLDSTVQEYSMDDVSNDPSVLIEEIQSFLNHRVEIEVEDKENVQFNADYFMSMIKHYTHSVNTLRLIRCYLAESDGEIFSVSSFDSGLNVILLGLWSDGVYSERDYIAKNLLEAMNAKSAVNLLSKLKEKGYCLETEEWEEYITNIESYKHAPVDWWITQIRATD